MAAPPFLIDLVRDAQTPLAQYLGVKRQAVQGWVAKGEVPPHRVNAVRDYFTHHYRRELQAKQELIDRLDAGKSSDPPKWARRMLIGMLALEAHQNVTDEDRAAALARLADELGPLQQSGAGA